MKNSLRSSALTVASQGARKGPAGRKGVGALPAPINRHKFGVTARSEPPPTCELKVTARPGSIFPAAGWAIPASGKTRIRTEDRAFIDRIWLKASRGAKHAQSSRPAESA